MLCKAVTSAGDMLSFIPFKGTKLSVLVLKEDANTATCIKDTSIAEERKFSPKDMANKGPKHFYGRNERYPSWSRLLLKHNHHKNPPKILMACHETR